ncbi:hypothetical protein FRC11_001221 [Ceratobasidium sp. 423]|nr:hypothetical protein FRC11_001221 [Ceratobasidium sp. 423]
MPNQKAPAARKTRPRRAAATATGQIRRHLTRQVSDDMRSPSPKRHRLLRVRNDSSDFEMQDAPDSDSDVMQVDSSPPASRSKSKKTHAIVVGSSSPAPGSSRSVPKNASAPRRITTGPKPRTAAVVVELSSPPGTQSVEPRGTSAQDKPSEPTGVYESKVVKNSDVSRLKTRRARIDKPKDKKVESLERDTYMDFWKDAIDKVAYERFHQKTGKHAD